MAKPQTVSQKALIRHLTERELPYYLISPVSDYVWARLLAGLEEDGFALQTHGEGKYGPSIFHDHHVVLAGFDLKKIDRWAKKEAKLGYCLLMRLPEEKIKEAQDAEYTCFQLTGESGGVLIRRLRKRYIALGCEIEDGVIEAITEIREYPEAVAALDYLAFMNEGRLQKRGLAQILQRRSESVPVFKLFETLLASRVHHLGKHFDWALSEPEAHPLQIAKALASLNRSQLMAFSIVLSGGNSKHIEDTITKPDGSNITSGYARVLASRCRANLLPGSHGLHRALNWVDEEVKERFQPDLDSLRNGLFLLLSE